MRPPPATVLILAAALSGCAVKGYDLGWRHDGPLTLSLGAPLDALSGCRFRQGEAVQRAPCATLVEDIRKVLRTAPAAPAVLGARCIDEVCTYANAYDRRDVGLAAILPVYRRVALREVRMQFRRQGAEFVLQSLIVRDNAPPGYGPVSVGASG